MTDKNLDFTQMGDPSKRHPYALTTSVTEANREALHSANSWLPEVNTGTPMPNVKPPKGESALNNQEGGDHYKKLKIQPIEYIHANGIPFAEGSVIKYVTRWRDKNGLKDLKKARHFIDLLIELEEKTGQ